ncbi:MAG TPA: glycine C-acetyltransferase [Polyangia bacterium]|jgi:glycine C-acetyltransferase
MFDRARKIYEHALAEIRDAELYKAERIITTPQGTAISVARPDGSGTADEMLSLCANNYLGLSSHPEVIAAAQRAIDTHGFGMSSVRFICGTQDLHRKLEARLSAFFATDDTILYGSCFDANGGLFETLLQEEDAIISDALNHASIIDGIRLCKAERHRYANGDLAQLEEILKATQQKRLRMIATDGVFSMDGSFAALDPICDLAERYDAMVMVDDSHATGFIGATGRGTPEHFGVRSRVDVLTSTLGKALGGAAGGFTTGHQAIIDLLRQRSRPYLFSNSLAPAIVGASLAVLDLVERSSALREQLLANAAQFRREMGRAGFTLKPGTHPIVPVMLGDAKRAQALAAELLSEGIYVIAFFFPVVPKGEARIRVQLSAAHTSAQIDRAVSAFTRAARKLAII